MAKYWLSLYTLETWQEAAKKQYRVAGFRANKLSAARSISAGDILLSYITGVKRWVAALEVESGPFSDYAPIWSSDTFPVRFNVRPLVKLTPQQGITNAVLADSLEMMKTSRWSGIRRGSPAQIPEKDALIILRELKEAAGQAGAGYETETPRRTVPETQEEDFSEASDSPHTRIQWRLLDLGSKMGLDVWVARSDRGRSYRSQQLSLMPRIRSKLDLPFPPEAIGIIEMIDVLWLAGNAIVAAFEVEHTTSIYSGILRMSDLLASQPNLNIKLYLVAPDERRHKVFQELSRPTFAKLNPPLAKLCKYISFSELERRIEALGDAVGDVLPSFIDRFAEAAPSLTG